ncbi:hypothetical protein GWK08_06020 [Leptobacterium flavescens]|uniref:Peptidase S74 domain-containing protein n=1 Tax=Leptobacterium flavescens TaxID=472055 RepID=A0A6P0UJ36_9FLAO|nr:tail fiber protein [Leptobacterium flavescens]NER12987.1 hypothetical protein [Leptobacterium flavescens]
MKKLQLISLFALAFTWGVNAQNTFPSSGNVGIGTITPAHLLELNTSSSTHALFKGTYTGIQGIQIERNGGDNIRLVTNYSGYGGGLESSSVLRFAVNNNSITNPSMYINNSGNVGIGTTNPLSRLFVYKGASGGSPHSFSDITVEDNDNGMISILTPNNRDAYFGFADQDDSYVGGMQYDHSNDEMTFRVNNHNSDMVIKSNGNVGIGTTSPEYLLHVNNGVKLRKTTIGATVGSAANSWIRDEWLTGNSGPPKWDESIQKWVRPSGTYNDIGGIIYQDEGTYFIRHQAGSQLEYTNTELLDKAYLFANMFNGNVGIGTTSPDSKLTVKGKIHAEEVKVDLSVPGPDYVFANDYDLRTLEELRKYIQQNKHLPNIPSAVEMEANGVELGIMNMKLLEKIEELTLYTLEQEKKIKNQEERLQKLENLLKNK